MNDDPPLSDAPAPVRRNASARRRTGVALAVVAGAALLAVAAAVAWTGSGPAALSGTAPPGTAAAPDRSLRPAAVTPYAGAVAAAVEPAAAVPVADAIAAAKPPAVITERRVGSTAAASRAADTPPPLPASRSGYTVGTEPGCSDCGTVEWLTPRTAYDASAHVAALGGELEGARTARARQAGSGRARQTASAGAAEPDTTAASAAQDPASLAAEDLGARLGRTALPGRLPQGHPAAFVAGVRMDDGTLREVGLLQAMPLGQRVQLGGGTLRTLDAIPRGAATGKVYRTD